jgi:hypothetical protein
MNSPRQLLPWIVVGLAALPAQDQPRRAVMPKALANTLPVTPLQTRVVVKLAEARADLLAGDAVAAPELLAVVGARFRQLDDHSRL